MFQYAIRGEKVTGKWYKNGIYGFLRYVSLSFVFMSVRFCRPAHWYVCILDYY